MRRRKFLVGMGALAAGTTGALGTGATLYEVQDRTAKINVVTDSYGALSLQATGPGDIVNKTADELEIDFGEFGGAGSGSDGVNVGSVARIGNFDLSANAYVYSPAAFTVTNQVAGTTLDFGIEYELTGNLNSSGSRLIFPVTAPHENSYTTLNVEDGSSDRDGSSSGNPVYRLAEPSTSGDDGNVTLDDIKPGQVLRFGIKVITNNSNSSTSENITGNLSISAVPADQDNLFIHSATQSATRSIDSIKSHQ